VETRIKVTKKELNRVKDKLKSEGYSIRDISHEIGSDFKNYVYKGHSIPEKKFNLLRELLDDEIEHEKTNFTSGKGHVSKFHIKKNVKSAELFGIILGDGHISEISEKKENYYQSSFSLTITLGRNEKELINHVFSLLKDVTKIEPKTHDLKGSRAVQLKIYNKELIESLVRLGLKSGNKVDNQVEVPSWIKESTAFQEKCLRGLIDTDGCIYRQSIDSRKIIRFKNRSLPLLEDFNQMCSSLDIRTSKGGGVYSTQIADQDEVKKFIKKVKPIKARKV